MKTENIQNWFAKFINRAANDLRACWQRCKDMLAAIVSFFRSNAKLTSAHLVGGIVVFLITRVPVVGKYLAVLALILAFSELVSRDQPPRNQSDPQPVGPDRIHQVVDRIRGAVRRICYTLYRWAAHVCRFVAARRAFFETVVVGLILALAVSRYIPWVGDLLSLVLFAISVVIGLERQAKDETNRIVIQIQPG